MQNAKYNKIDEEIEKEIRNLLKEEENMLRQEYEHYRDKMEVDRYISIIKINTDIFMKRYIIASAWEGGDKIEKYVANSINYP